MPHLKILSVCQCNRLIGLIKESCSLIMINNIGHKVKKMREYLQEHSSGESASAEGENPRMTKARSP